MPRADITFVQAPVSRSADAGKACSSPGEKQRSIGSLAFDLFKLRIGLVIAVTALAGAAITPGSALGLVQSAELFIGVALSAAAAGAFNQFHEREIDARMTRTRQRAFVTGRLRHHSGWLVAIAVIGAAGVGMVAMAANVVSATYSALGALIYGFVYTVWLKPRTPWNIVIGGLAGSCAVLCGATAVTAQPPAVSLAFALVLFLWTPPHFWSLAIACRDDYAAAGIPMLPVIVGSARAARTVQIGTALLVAASLLPAAFGAGWAYVVAASIAGGMFLCTSTALARWPTRERAMSNFHVSLAYLSLLLLAVFVDAAWHGTS